MTRLAAARCYRLWRRWECSGGRWMGWHIPRAQLWRLMRAMRDEA
jgi:hypothetical protein